MIQHAGSSGGGGWLCGGCRLFTSGTWLLQVRGSSRGDALGVGAGEQRRSLVQAVGGHVAVRAPRDFCLLRRLCTREGGPSWGWRVVGGGRAGAAAGAGCWCRVAPVRQPQWRQPGGGRSSAVPPPPLFSSSFPGMSTRCHCRSSYVQSIRISD